MSEFTCRNNHDIPPGQYFCPECGEPIRYMDGQSRRELEAEERDYRDRDMEDDDNAI